MYRVVGGSETSLPFEVRKSYGLGEGKVLVEI